jgi:hypothetical protein
MCFLGIGGTSRLSLCVRCARLTCRAICKSVRRLLWTLAPASCLLEDSGEAAGTKGGCGCVLDAPARASRAVLTGALDRADEAYGFLSPPGGSELAGSWTIFGAGGGLRLFEVVTDLMPAASPLERHGNPAGYLILAYMFVGVRPSMPRSLTSSPEGSWSDGVPSSHAR